MGMPPFMSSSSSSRRCDYDSNYEPSPPNPNPRNFKIDWCGQINGWTIAIITYPGCTTYSGQKLCVYNATKKEVESSEFLDPHFGDGDHLYPVARFEPTTQGLSAAIAMANGASQIDTSDYEGSDALMDNRFDKSKTMKDIAESGVRSLIKMIRK